MGPGVGPPTRRFPGGGPSGPPNRRFGGGPVGFGGPGGGPGGPGGGPGGPNPAGFPPVPVNRRMGGPPLPGPLPGPGLGPGRRRPPPPPNGFAGRPPPPPPPRPGIDCIYIFENIPTNLNRFFPFALLRCSAWHQARRRTRKDEAEVWLLKYFLTPSKMASIFMLFNLQAAWEAKHSGQRAANRT